MTPARNALLDGLIWATDAVVSRTRTVARPSALGRTERSTVLNSSTASTSASVSGGIAAGRRVWAYSRTGPRPHRLIGCGNASSSSRICAVSAIAAGYRIV